MSKNRERYQSFVEELKDDGYPLEPEDCPIITFTAMVPVPGGLPVLVWAAGPQEGQIYTEPETLTVAGGVEIPTPTWWTFTLERLGIIRRTQLFVREWQDIHAAVCAGGPETSPHGTP